MQRYRIVLEYMGNKFIGWQRQSPSDGSSQVASVSGVLEQALLACAASGAGQLHGGVVGAGRTDGGVHALGQVAHFDFAAKRAAPFDGRSMQHMLSHHIAKPHCDHVRVVRCDPVHSDFHARFDCVKRTYCYRLTLAPHDAGLFEAQHAWSLAQALDLDRMHAACQLLTGEHDFAAFRNAGCIAQSTIRTVELSLSTVAHDAFDSIRQHGALDEVRGVGRQHVFIRAESRSFLYRQVRLMVAALVDVGSRRRTLADVRASLHTGTQQPFPIKPAPAHGLYFVAAHYSR
jgi:tRNA pseudouridine38-40 synthase